jgi:predicted transcriptional regulator
MTRRTIEERQSIILAAVHFHKSAGLKELARKLNTSQAHVSLIVNEMMDKELLYFKSWPKSHVICLTDKGLDILKDK